MHARTIVFVLLFCGLLLTPARAQEGRTMVSGFDGATLVHVPAGWFVMGSKRGDKDERPPRRVFVSAFWIDQTEATAERFRAFRRPNRLPDDRREAQVVLDVGRFSEKGQGRLAKDQGCELAPARGSRLGLEEPPHPARLPRELVRRGGLLPVGGQASAHRGGVGARCQRRGRQALPLGQAKRRPQSQPQRKQGRISRRGARGQLSPGREPLRRTRHGGQPLGVGGRFISSRRLPQHGRTRSARPGEGQDARRARRFLGESHRLGHDP